ncbi:MAG: sigma-70 family RNA polymerase sigma factor [Planctomycetia bacterium]|nr:sigma-70 family RNA polymerase sigma factor [Planctomycetia bacterium]
MIRILNCLREQLTSAQDTDRHLLDRFRTTRDESAFAELVRRYGPVVCGVCRRWLTNFCDAEDAFQATFLVLLRRAARLDGDAPIGPWLYKVAVMTARNVIRSNRRRVAITGPMEHEVPASAPETSAERLDLDAALLALPERDRVAVVLCHLQGLTRREAAERLGCPEGTLSARLNRALQRLRARFGDSVPTTLAASAITLPIGLAQATVRSATIYSTSTLTAAGVSPAVVKLTDGVIRMFWMKKVMTAAVVMLLVVGAGVLALGVGGRSEHTAHATEPLTPSAPPATPEDPDPLKRLEKRLAALEKQKQLLDATLEDLKAEKKKLDDAKKEKDAEAAAAELGKDIAVVVGSGQSPTYTVREVVNGRVAEVSCSNLGILKTYLTRAFNDPKGPKQLRISAYKDHPTDHLRKVFAACAAAGYTKASFSHNDYRVVVLEGSIDSSSLQVELYEIKPQIKPGEIDLKKFAEPKKP